MDSAVAKLNEVEAQLGETEELVAARELVEQRRGEVRQIQERQKSLDWDAEEARRKALEIEGRLYGGTVKNPKELEDLQADLDAWLQEYNEQRPHQGRWCYGKTPMHTFIDSVPLAKEKMLAA